MKNKRYENGKIYKLVNDIDEKIYVGSTCNSLAQRFGYHKLDGEINGHRQVYKHLNLIGWQNVHIILIEEYPCKNKEQLISRERYWYDELKPELNKNVPGRTKQEYKKIYYSFPENRAKKVIGDTKYNSSEHKKKYMKEDYNTRKYKCECGTNILLISKNNHLKSNKHHKKMIKCNE